MRHLRRIGLLAAAVALLGADWPQWRGPHRDGKSPATGLLDAIPKEGPLLVWRLESVERVGTGYGSPAVVGDRLYIVGGASAKADAPETVHCIHALTGEKVWSQPIPTAPGKFLEGWGGGPRSTPTVDGDRLYVLGATGDLVCLSAADGKVVWAKNLVGDFGGEIPKWGYSESPLVDGELVVVTPGNAGAITALKKATGEQVWTTEGLGEQAGYSSLIPTNVGGVRQYVTQTMEQGVGVRASDGKLLWTTKGIKRSVAVIPSPVVTPDNVVFFTAGYGAGCEAVRLVPDGDGTKAERLFDKFKSISNHHGGVIEFEGHIYGHSDRSGWVCLDLAGKDDEPLWKSTKLGKGSITYADGHFYCYSEAEGIVAQIRATPEDWQETGRFRIPELSKLRPGQGKVWAHPVVAHGHIYLRDYENLYCYKISQ